MEEQGLYDGAADCLPCGGSKLGFKAAVEPQPLKFFDK
jgi:hypothetical protein